MTKHKRIFIIGHIGAGKAVFAKALADKLGWKFIDSDLGLDARVGLTLADIIGKQGEESFHQCQSKILAHQINKEKVVIGTDGNILATEKNRKLLSSECVVYLKSSTQLQLERLTIEPLLPIDFKIFLDKLHLERDALYDKAAHFTIDASKPLDEAVNEVVKLLAE